MAGGNATKIGIIVVALALAVGIFVYTQKPQQAQHVVEVTQRDLVCTKCNVHFTMPVKEFDEAAKTAPTMEGGDAPPEGGRTRRTPVKPPLLKCPQCSEVGAVLAVKCPNSDTWYPKVEPDGTLGHCPD